MKYTKEELEKLIFEDKLSYREIGRIYNVSDTNIKKQARKLGIELPRRAIFPSNWKPANTGTAMYGKCLNCDNETKNSYCSQQCCGEHTSKKKYQDFIDNNEQYCRASYSPSKLKPFFLKEQDYKCAICEIENKWNNKLLVFVCDHIDGNAANNKRSNLRLICHNCDSQLDTYKSKNKNSARSERYLRSVKESI